MSVKELILGEPRLCAYWPKSDKLSRLGYFIPSRQSNTQHDLKRFKFELLERGAVSNMSGAHIPICPSCPSTEYCRPLRLRNSAFELSHSQADKLHNFNSSITFDFRRPIYSPDFFDLFKRYVVERHGNTSTHMTGFGPENFKRLLEESAWMVVAKEKVSGTLVSFALIDDFADSFSLEYMVYYTGFKKLSPGISTILKVASLLKESCPNGHLYFGSWSPNSPKIGYKSDFIGLEIYSESGWQPIERNPSQIPPPALDHLLNF